MTFRQRPICSFPNNPVNMVLSAINIYSFIPMMGNEDLSSFPRRMIWPAPTNPAPNTLANLPTIKTIPEPSLTLSAQPGVSFTLGLLHLFASFGRCRISEIGLAVSLASFGGMMTFLHGVLHSLPDFRRGPLPQSGLSQLLTRRSRTSHFMISIA